MRPETTPDAEIAALAVRQHGVVALAQLLALGLTREAVKRRVRAGRLHRLHRGVFAVGHRRLTREGRWLAAVLACGPGAVLSHRSAAALLGIRATVARRVDVTVPRSSGRRSTAAIQVHRPVRMPATTVRDGIPVTTAAATLSALAPMLDDEDLRRALEAAERLRLLDARALPPRLAALAGTVETSVRSVLEGKFLDLCRRHGLPMPLVNTIVEGYEVDFCWPDQRLIVETDGHEHHGTRAAFERDRVRDATLTALGWRVVRLTHRRIHGEPGAVAGLLAQLLSVRSRWPSTP